MPATWLLRPSPWLLAVTLLLSLGASAACTPVIGDSCSLSTDCASDGTRVCDTAESGGFCTVLNCTGTNLGSSCPDNAVCVLFNANVPGCPLSAYEQSRTAYSECRNTCGTNGDCRSDYLCADPTKPPWSAQLLDSHTGDKVCLPQLVFLDGGISPVNYGFDGSPDAVPPVCQAAGPTFDAGFPPLDAAADVEHDAGMPDARDDDGAADAHADGKVDATLDGGHHDGSSEAAVDAAHDAEKEGGLDATRDGDDDARAKDAAHDGG